MTLPDDEAEPCAFLVRTAGKLIRCGCTRVEYQVGGRQVTRSCMDWKRCGGLARLDVTIDHGKHNWTLNAIRAWWAKVYG